MPDPFSRGPTAEVLRDLITYLILAPAAMFAEALFGSGKLGLIVRTLRWTRGVIAAAVGASLFAALAGYETLFNTSVLGPGISLERFGMLALIGGLGLLVAERVIDSERRLVALSQELQTAQRIQRSILPADVPRSPGLTIAARHMPMAEVAGDFYEGEFFGDRRLGEWLQATQACDPTAVADLLLRELRSWTEAPGRQLTDNVTLVVAAVG